MSTAYLSHEGKNVNYAVKLLRDNAVLGLHLTSTIDQVPDIIEALRHNNTLVSMTWRIEGVENRDKFEQLDAKINDAIEQSGNPNLLNFEVFMPMREAPEGNYSEIGTKPDIIKSNQVMIKGIPSDTEQATKEEFEQAAMRLPAVYRTHFYHNDTPMPLALSKFIETAAEKGVSIDMPPAVKAEITEALNKELGDISERMESMSAVTRALGLDEVKVPAEIKRSATQMLKVGGHAEKVVRRKEEMAEPITSRGYSGMGGAF